MSDKKDLELQLVEKTPEKSNWEKIQELLAKLNALSEEVERKKNK